MRKIFLIVMAIMLFINSANASQGKLGTFKQDECIRLIQTCADCNYNNITSVVTPNLNILLSGEIEMTKTGTEYNYTFCNTSIVGVYTVNGHGDINGKDEIWVYDFEVTPSGSEKIGSGEGIGIVGILFLIIIIGVAFFIVGFKTENIVGKIGFFCFSIIVFIMAILYIIIFAQQNLYGFEGLVSGVENFWFVMKMLLTVGILAFFIIVALILIKAWKIKRGYIDV